MRIEYANTYWDVVRFHVLHQFLSPVVQGAYLLFAIFIFAAESTRNTRPASAAVAVSWYLGFWLLQFAFNALYLVSRKHHTVLTAHSVEITDDAFVEETRYNKSYFYWNGIVKVVTRPGFVAVYVTPHLAHIIPARAFASSQQRDEFVASIRNRLPNQAL